jgi:hypothetical protein
MKKTMTTLALAIVLASSALAQGYHYVRPYYRHNGTFVPGHYKTNPDRNIYNNWNTIPNINPFNGRPGTIDPNYYIPRPRSYSNPYGY